MLELELPDVLRLEYKLEVDHPDGGTEWILDPGNPKRAPGAFGEKSVLELPGYEPPAWLERRGRRRGASTRSRSAAAGSGATVAIRVWSPADVEPGTPLRMLLANDGPEYDALSSLTRFSAAMIAAGELPPHRVALLAPGERNQWYSRLGRLRARAGPRHRAGAARRRSGVIGAPVGDGREPRRPGDAARPAALPARVRRAVPAVRQLLHARATTPRSAASSRYARIIRFVRETLRDGQYAIPVPVTITVGRAEENAHNNREMARALAAQGYDVSLEEVPDMHNYVGWRDAFDPHLTALLQTRLETAMNAHHHELYSHAIGASGAVAAYGHYGRAGARVPLRGRQGVQLAGQRHDRRAVGPARRRAGSSSTASIPSTPCRGRTSRSRSRSARAQHERYESWILDDVVPFIQHDTGGEIITTGI